MFSLKEFKDGKYATPPIKAYTKNLLSGPGPGNSLKVF